MTAATTTPPTSEHPSEPHIAGRAWIALAAVLWSSSGLFAKSRAFDSWTPGQRGPLLAFWRAAFAALVLLPAVRRPRWTPMLVPMVAFFTAMNVTYLTAMSRTTAANAIWLQSTAPWWVFLLGIVLLRQKPARAELPPLVFAAVGLIVILCHEIQGPQQIGVACGLASGISYAAVIVLMREMRGEDAAWLVALNHSVTAVILLPYVVYLGVWPDARQLVLLAAFGVVQMAIPYLLLARGLRTISSQEAVGITLLEPVLLPFWAYLVRREVPAWWTVLGGALILTGLVLRYAGLRRFGGRKSAIVKGLDAAGLAAASPDLSGQNDGDEAEDRDR